MTFEKTKVHIEGWRKINHSYALVNRNHLRWMLKDPRLSITHREMPYYKPHWVANPNSSFPEVFEEVLNLPDQDAPEDVDITLRIDFPHRFDLPPKGKLLVFGTTEYTRVSPENMRGDVAAAARNPNVLILTPSTWSAQGFLKLGFPQERVWVLPHGVDKEHFRITTPDEKARYRTLLGIDQQAKVFLHVGGGWFGKGLDLLIEAFSIHAKTHPQSRLVIKGHDALYGNAVLNAFANRPLSLPPGVELAREQILYLGGDLSDESMDHLYRLADCYVATYRGEGFNMPLLEAAARGIEVIATEGGPSNDYLPHFFGTYLVASKKKDLGDGNEFLEPDRSQLITHLNRHTKTNDAKHTNQKAYPTMNQHERFSWESVSDTLSQMIITNTQSQINFKTRLQIAAGNQGNKQSNHIVNRTRTVSQQRTLPSIHVAFCTDNTYAPQLAAALVSLFLSNWNEELTTYIVSNEITLEHKARYEKIALTYGRKLKFLTIDPNDFASLVHYYQPHSAYYRLALPELIQDQQKLIYLDSDIVVEANIRELWDSELKGNLVGGVAERDALQAPLQAHINVQGDPYINSGVLVIDLEQWRQQEIGKKCVDWIQKNPQTATMMDQDAINVVCHGRKRFINQKWNLNPIHGPPEITLQAYPERIIHFAGPIKPWHAWYSQLLIDKFYHYLSMTPWINDVPQVSPELPGQYISIANQTFKKEGFRESALNYQAAINILLAQQELKQAIIEEVFVAGSQILAKQAGHEREACAIFRSILNLWGFPTDAGDIYKIPYIR
jgi:lipopolysaccharide biosynthesis glycosyltransferase/glycosyltransferase involved in cell wall biosynthesis